MKSALKEFNFRNGPVTVEHQLRGLQRLTGLGVTGWPCKRGPVDAKTARYIAENTPGGAIIVWEGDEKSHEYAHVYSRSLRMQA